MKPMMTKCSALALCLMILLHSMADALPQKVLYQGTLRRSGTIFTGNGTFLFRVTDATGATEYWTSGSTVVAVTSGLFRYPLGVDNLGGTGLNSKPFANIPWALIEPYVEVTVDGILLSPREPLSSVPYALYLSTGNQFSVADSTFVVTGGRVGIGTSNPSTKLHVVGGDVLIGNPSSHDLTADEDLLVKGNVIIDGQFIGHTTSGSSITFTSSGDFIIGTSTLVVTSGKVGIGTTNPAGNLHVVTPNNTDDNQPRFFSGGAGGTWNELMLGSSYGAPWYSLAFLRYYNGAGTAANSRLSIFHGGDQAYTGLTLIGGGNTGINDDGPDAQLEVKSSVSPTGFIVAISSQNDTTGNILSVLGNGNVGIGVTNPANLLDVNGSIRMSGAGEIHLTGNDTAPSNLSTITSEAGGFSMRFKARGGDNPDLVVATSGNIGIGTSAPGNKLHMSTGTIFIDGSNTVSMITNGHVGIGTAAATSRLHIGGGNVLHQRDPADSDIQYALRRSDGAGDPDMYMTYWGQGDRNTLALTSGAGHGIHVTTNGYVIVGNFTPTSNFSGSGKFAVMDGDVGIGIASPGAGLHIRKAANAPLVLENAVDLAETDIEFRTAGTQKAWVGYAPANALLSNTGIGLKLRAKDGVYIGSNDDNVRISITAGGNVGIGATNPNMKLHVSSGTIKVDGSGAPATGGALCLNSAGTMSKCTTVVDASGNCTCP